VAPVHQHLLLDSPPGLGLGLWSGFSRRYRVLKPGVPDGWTVDLPNHYWDAPYGTPSHPFSIKLAARYRSGVAPSRWYVGNDVVYDSPSSPPRRGA
jgi:hypothetical protein